jgi:hypothetical protein
MAYASCGKCKSEWTGEGRCHCGHCHLTFAGLAAFDRHQQNVKGLCGNPASQGMVMAVKPWGVMWSLGTAVMADRLKEDG